MFGNRAKPLLANLANVWQSCEATGGNVCQTWPSYRKGAWRFLPLCACDVCHCWHSGRPFLPDMAKRPCQSWLFLDSPDMAICQTWRFARKLLPTLPEMAICQTWLFFIYYIYLFILCYIFVHGPASSLGYVVMSLCRCGCGGAPFHTVLDVLDVTCTTK